MLWNSVSIPRDFTWELKLCCSSLRLNSYWLIDFLTLLVNLFFWSKLILFLDRGSVWPGLISLSTILYSLASLSLLIPWKGISGENTEGVAIISSPSKGIFLGESSPSNPWSKSSSILAYPLLLCLLWLLQRSEISSSWKMVLICVSLSSLSSLQVLVGIGWTWTCSELSASSDLL